MNVRIFCRIFFLLFCLTSCDYGKDISDLKDRVDNLEDSFSQLKSAWEAGKIIEKLKLQVLMVMISISRMEQ